jgi:transposase-like protein
MTKRLCRRCQVPLSTDNARRFNGRWVGACRKCETAEGVARQRQHFEMVTCPMCGHSKRRRKALARA